MIPELSTTSAPWELLLLCLLLLLAPVVASPRHIRAWAVAGLAALAVVTLLAESASGAYAAVAAAAVLHAVTAWSTSRTGALALLASAACAVGTGVAMAAGAPTAATCFSLLAIAIRSGVLPLHAGVASLCDRAPIVQVQQVATLVTLVFVHLRFVDQHAGAAQLAPFLMMFGGVVTLAAALLTAVQSDLRGFYRGTVTMHAGMLLAALGAASLDSFAPALMVTVTTAMAVGGLGVVIVALEERVGRVSLATPGGRVDAFPRLALVFALFGGAGVGLPGTAGFIADDVLLHALWLASPASATMVVLATATLAVATLRCYSAIFLGTPVRSLAPDLSGQERGTAFVLALSLVLLGLAPWLLIGPTDEILGNANIATRVAP